MCELLHTSNHRYFGGNNKGPLSDSDATRLVMARQGKGPGATWGPFSCSTGWSALFHKSPFSGHFEVGIDHRHCRLLRRAASDHATAAPPRAKMNWRRLECRERSIVRGDRGRVV